MLELQHESRIYLPSCETVVNHTANDVTRTLDVLPTRPEFDPQRVAVAGFSMGGATTMVLAWREPRISAIIPICGCVDSCWGRHEDRARPEARGEDRRVLPTAEAVDGIAGLQHAGSDGRDRPKALLLLNGTKDVGIDIRSVRKFAEEILPALQRLSRAIRFLRR